MERKRASRSVETEQGMWLMVGLSMSPAYLTNMTLIQNKIYLCCTYSRKVRITMRRMSLDTSDAETMLAWWIGNPQLITSSPKG